MKTMPTISIGFYGSVAIVGFRCHKPRDDDNCDGAVEDDADHLDRDGAVEADRGIMGGVAAGRNCRHRVVYGIESRHPRSGVGDRAGNAKCEVDADGQARHLIGGVGGLAGDVRGFHVEELHAADTKERQEHDRGHDDAGAADPLQERAPEQEPGRHGVQPHQNRGSRRRQPRERLERRIGQAEVQR
jgi:hypothetical protein